MCWRVWVSSPLCSAWRRCGFSSTESPNRCGNCAKAPRRWGAVISTGAAVRSRDECGQLAMVFNGMTENIHQSRAQLEKTVETLKTTQEQLVQSEKLSAIGKFVAGVAHELNNPLTAVVGFSEVLKRGTKDEKNRHYSDTILKAALRCKRIVQSLLSFARRE